MNELARQQKVIITRVGSFWVDKERADKIDQIRENDPTAVIEIDDNKVQAAAIYASLTPGQYQNYQNEKRGLWQCVYKNWHPRNDNCMCARNIPQRPPESRILSDEERAKAAVKLAEMRKRFGKRKDQNEDSDRGRSTQEPNREDSNKPDSGQHQVSEEVRLRRGADDQGQMEVPDESSEGGIRGDVDSSHEQRPRGTS